MTSAGSAVRPAADAAAYRAVEHIYHSYLTGLILMLASRAGAAHAAERRHCVGCAHPTLAI